MLTTNKFICFPDEAFRHPAASMRDARPCRDQGPRFVEAALFNAFIVTLFIERTLLLEYDKNKIFGKAPYSASHLEILAKWASKQVVSALIFEWFFVKPLPS